MQILAAMMFLTCTPAALLDFAEPKWKADPSLEIRDAYKYLYQATRGGEHAAPDIDSVRRSLETEWRSLGERMRNENVWEPLGPGAEIGRLNLRPFRDGGGKVNDLADAFVASSRSFRSEPAAFINAWNELGKRLKQEPIGKLTHKEWQKFNAEMKKQNFPSVGHSQRYKKANRPAYRILTLDAAQRLMPS